MYTNQEIGNYIKTKRQTLNMTQQVLAEKLNVSPQAVSKWENGDSLPDTQTLLPLSHALGTSTDTLLSAGKGVITKKGMIDLVKIRKGMKQLSELKDLIGKDNTIYKGLIKGVTELMNTDFESVLNDDYYIEAFIVEIAIQQLMAGYDIDLGNIDHVLRYDHWASTLKKYTKKYE